MANTFFTIVSPQSDTRLSLTAYVRAKGQSGGLQVTVGMNYVSLDKEQALSLAHAIMARYYNPEITATGYKTLDTQ